MRKPLPAKGTIVRVIGWNKHWDGIGKVITHSGNSLIHVHFFNRKGYFDIGAFEKKFVVELTNDEILKYKLLGDV
jgi:hypothetical protein